MTTLTLEKLVAILSDDLGLTDDLLAAHDIHISTAVLPGTCHALIYHSRRNRCHIVVNSDLRPDCRNRAGLHELHHAIKDCPKQGCLIGWDQWHTTMEKDADQFAIANECNHSTAKV